MDPFTQNILERAEKRAAALGITNTSKFPLSEFNYEVDKQPTGGSPKKKSAVKKHSAPKPPSTTSVSTRTATDGERTTTVDIGGQDNCDVALEINITTSANLQVDLGVKELENDGTVKKQWEHNIVRALEGEKENSAEAKSLIRDQSRNQLQRLGTLYSETQDLSSPVHRTEGRFHEDMKQTSKPKPKLAKLAMLADSINNWEDDTSHPDITHHRETIVPGREPKSPTARRQSPKRAGGSGSVASAATGTGATPKKYPAPNPPKSILSPHKLGSNGGESSGAAGKPLPTKSLKWDQKVMDTLESQGFQRRESTTSKLVYDYQEGKNGKKPDNYRAQTAAVSSATTTSRERSTTQVDQAEDAKKSAATATTTTTTATQQKKPGGLVSGRAAMFEKSSGRRQSILKPGQKDPAEMSLKERMAIFEKNKGAALVPKAAFGISPSIRQITGQKDGGKSASSGSGPMSCAAIQGSGFGSITQQARTNVAPASPQGKPKADHSKSAPKVETKATGSAIRNTVEALMSDTSTISQSEISEEIRRMRQQEMDMLLNRFTKPADMSSDTISYDSQPIPSAPPMPPEGYLTASGKKKSKQSLEGNGHNGLPAKRRSDGSNDSPGVMATLDEVKRIRVASTAKDGRMYPALSDIETTATESGDEGAVGDDYTTATVSGSEESERAYRTCYGDVGDDEHAVEEEDEYEEEDDNERHRYEVDEDDDSFMYSDDDEEANIANVSLGREILQAVKLNDRRTSRGRRQSQDWNQGEEEVAQTQATKGVTFSLERSDASDGSDQLEDSDLLDACLEEAFVDEVDEDSDTPRKSSVSSNSFSYQKHSGRDRCNTINEEDSEKVTSSGGSSKRKSGTPRKSHGGQPPAGTVDYSSPVRSELQVKPSKDDDMVTLVHTVSFYRRQQQQQNTVTPRKIPRPPIVTSKTTNSPGNRAGTVDSTATFDSDEEDVSSTAESTSTGTEEGEFLVQEKVKKLLDEVCKQQTIIAQASQALNLCAATIEFSGSSESVEGERHLLVATHRRQAILDEVQRLRVEGCLRPPGAPTEKGRLTVKDITLPLKQEYMRKLAADQISGHNLVCLLKYNETVLATQTAPTLPGLLSVRFPDVLQLSNVFADFKITMEIYGMPASREVLPHEIKYHIALGKKKGGGGSNKLLHTPKALKSNSRLIMPPVQSPAGPQAVRSPSLTLYGFIIFSLKEIQRTSWTLNPISGCASPLDGTVNMRVNCELAVTVDYHGFLTMYEDVSGLGAWHRRWCRLQRHVINYWRYPDDEKRKAPIGSIDLQGCITQRVGVAPRDICSRLNTLMLEFARPARDDDVESLKVVRQGKTTIERYLLSADSKEERDEWCAHLNKTLALLKAWGSSNVTSS
ncbi:anillin [Anopheles maculipalpis]|uniref:anillin n=1 Tax=Anopheles maculipalpis TaxID=1496333 RepID=UPI00215957DA|nr:anillin [Anopheles maculipalpis]